MYKNNKGFEKKYFFLQLHKEWNIIEVGKLIK